MTLIIVYKIFVNSQQKTKTIAPNLNRNNNNPLKIIPKIKNKQIFNNNYLNSRRYHYNNQRSHNNNLLKIIPKNKKNQNFNNNNLNSRKNHYNNQRSQKFSS